MPSEREMAAAESVPAPVYLYAVIAAETGAAAALHSGTLGGLDPAERLFPVTAGALVAAASAVPPSLLAALEGAPAPPDLAAIAPFAVRHAEVIRALQPLAPALIPLSFGAIYRDPASVAAFLEAQEETLRRLLGDLDHKEEWTLKIYRDEARAAVAAEAASPVLCDLDAAIAAATPGRAHLLRKRREQARRGEIERGVRAALEDLLTALRGQTVAVQVDEPLAAPERGEWLVLKAACLIENGQSAGFAEWLAECGRAWSAVGLRFDCTGPWAPYSFVRAAS